MNPYDTLELPHARILRVQEINFILNIFYVYDLIELKISMIGNNIKMQLFYCQSLTHSVREIRKLAFPLISSMFMIPLSYNFL